MRNVSLGTSEINVKYRIVDRSYRKFAKNSDNQLDLIQFRFIRSLISMHNFFLSKSVPRIFICILDPRLNQSIGIERVFFNFQRFRFKGWNNTRVVRAVARKKEKGKRERYEERRWRNVGGSGAILIELISSTRASYIRGSRSQKSDSIPTRGQSAISPFFLLFPFFENRGYNDRWLQRPRNWTALWWKISASDEWKRLFRKPHCVDPRKCGSPTLSLPSSFPSIFYLHLERRRRRSRRRNYASNSTVENGRA